MQVGTLLKGRLNENLYIIKEETIIYRNGKSGSGIKGYRVAPCNDVAWSFLVTEYEMLLRFMVMP